jgi:hypothetical protein
MSYLSRDGMCNLGQHSKYLFDIFERLKVLKLIVGTGPGYPVSSCKRIAPASRSGGAHLPLPQRRSVGLWRAAAAVVLVACSGSLCCPTQSHSDRHWQPRRLRQQISDGPEYLCRSWPTSLEGISINNEWENWLRTPFLAHHKPKYIGPISANAGLPCTME